MSYSFSLKGVDKADLRAQITKQMDGVVISQPEHAADRAPAEAAANAAIDTLMDDASKHIAVSMSGSLGWRMTGETKEFTSCNISVNAYLMTPSPA